LLYFSRGEECMSACVAAVAGLGLWVTWCTSIQANSLSLLLASACPSLPVTLPQVHLPVYLHLHTHTHIHMHTHTRTHTPHTHTHTHTAVWFCVKLADSIISRAHDRILYVFMYGYVWIYAHVYNIYNPQRSHIYIYMYIYNIYVLYMDVCVCVCVCVCVSVCVCLSM
jgi:hypothetical protein